MSSLQLSSLSSGRQLPALATSIPIPRMGRNEASPSRMFAKTGARSSQFETLTISPASNPNCQKRSSTSRLKVVPSAMCQSPPLRPVSSVSNSKPVRSRFVSGISNHLTNRTARPLEDGAKQLADYFLEHNKQQKHQLFSEMCVWCKRDGLEGYNRVVKLLCRFQVLYSANSDSYIHLLVKEVLKTTEMSQAEEVQYAATICELFNYLIKLAPNLQKKMLLCAQLIESGFDSFVHNLHTDPNLNNSLARFNDTLRANLDKCFTYLEENISQSMSCRAALINMITSKLAVCSLENANQPKFSLFIKTLRKISLLLWPERLSNSIDNSNQSHLSLHLLQFFDRYVDLLTTEHTSPSSCELTTMLDNLLNKLEIPSQKMESSQNGDKSTVYDQNGDSSFSSISSFSLLSASPTDSLYSLDGTETSNTRAISNSSNCAISVPSPSAHSSPFLSPPPPPPPPPPPTSRLSFYSSPTSIPTPPPIPGSSISTPEMQPGPINQKTNVSRHNQLSSKLGISSISNETDNDNKLFVDILIKKPKNKMKTINWAKIPLNAIEISNEQQPNVWQLIGQKCSKESEKTTSCELAVSKSEYLVNFEQLEELFCISTPPSVLNSCGNGQKSAQLHLSAANSCPTSPQVARRASCGPSSSKSEHSGDSPLSLDYAFSGHASEETEPPVTNDFGLLPIRSHIEPLVSVLDSKRTLSVNIFLKQYRGTTLDEIVRLIKEDRHAEIGLEKLRTLQGLLPSDSEISLLCNASEMSRMPLAERFLCALIGLQDYRLKIEFMLLRQEFDAIAGLERTISCVHKAGYELMKSGKLQEILTLFLVSGNFLNFGGYGGNAGGFKISSLPKLAEIRSNKPGLNMIHYVAMQAETRGLVNFVDELPNLKEASKISIENLKGEVRLLSEKISSIKLQLSKQKKVANTQLIFLIENFLKESDQCIERLKKETENDLELLRQKQRFKIAVEENRKRAENQQKIKARQGNIMGLGTGKMSKDGLTNRSNVVTSQITGLLELPSEPLKVMSRSLESSNGGEGGGGDSILERTASLNRRRSRPNSQDAADLHSNLVEFLTNPSYLETSNIDNNIFGTHFRRVSSGRRSLRNLACSTTSPILEDNRERLLNESTSISDSSQLAPLSTKFNRFSPFRRTLTCKSNGKLNEDINLDKLTNPSIEVLDNGNKTKICFPIPVIKVIPESSDPIVETAKKESPDAKQSVKKPKQLPIISSIRKNASQYIQQLTAIISPTKFIESNDSLHQTFGNAFTNPSTDMNIIVSTVAKERPFSSISSSLPPISLRKTPSFVLSPDGKATPANAAIVQPMQKIEHTRQVEQIKLTNNLSNESTQTAREPSKVERKARQERKVIHQKVSSLSSLPPRDSSQLKGSCASKSSIPVSKSTTSTNRAKVSVRQQSAANKRIAWARNTNGHS